MNSTDRNFQKVHIPHLKHTMKLALSENMRSGNLVKTEFRYLALFFPEQKVTVEELVYFEWD